MKSHVSCHLSCIHAIDNHLNKTYAFNATIDYDSYSVIPDSGYTIVIINAEEKYKF